MSDTDLDPMAMNDVERELHRLSQELTRVTLAIGNAATRAAQADVDYKRMYARAWVAKRGHKGTVAEKEAEIHGEVEDEYERKTLREAEYRVFQEKARNLRAQLDALRTIAANVRSVVTGR